MSAELQKQKRDLQDAIFYIEMAVQIGGQSILFYILTPPLWLIAIGLIKLIDLIEAKQKP